jgi:DNA polymerase elongation subunit (family B)
MFIKRFQEALIHRLFDVETVEEVYSVGYKRALAYLFKTIDRVMCKKISIKELIVSKTLHKPTTEYTKFYPHVSASITLNQQGKMAKKGETIDFVYVNTTRRNPFRRVVPIDLYDNTYYDSEKYRTMVLDASETVLSSFGFSRHHTTFKSSIVSTKRDLLQDLG